MAHFNKSDFIRLNRSDEPDDASRMKIEEQNAQDQNERKPFSYKL